MKVGNYHQRPMAANSTSGAGAGDTIAIVTCHNYARFLAACLDSLLAQTHPFRWIVVVDDSSGDETSAIAAAYATKFPQIKHTKVWVKNACLARAAGVAMFPLPDRPRFWLFMDADNTIDPNCHALLREPMGDPRLGIAYPTIVYHDAAMKPTGKTLAHHYDHDLLRKHNIIDTTAIVRAEAYQMAGGWNPDAPIFQDWDLWLRVTRAGWLARLIPSARLNYRVHHSSMTAAHMPDMVNHQVRAMARAMTVTIVTLFSGRIWQLGRYEKILARLKWNRANLTVLAIDNSNDVAFSVRLRHVLQDSGLRHIIHTERRQAIPVAYAEEVAGSHPLRSAHCFAINEHLAYLYSMAQQLMPSGTDLVFSLEDDVEPDPDCLLGLTRGLVADYRTGVVCASVANRFGTQFILAWRGGFDRHACQIDYLDQEDEFYPVSGSGFMATLFRCQVFRQLAFRGSPHWDPRRRPYYDWAAAYEVKASGWNWTMATRVICGHRESSGELVLPKFESEKPKLETQNESSYPYHPTTGNPPYSGARPIPENRTEDPGCV